jgi:hypothetical protein
MARQTDAEPPFWRRSRRAAWFAVTRRSGRSAATRHRPHDRRPPPHLDRPGTRRPDPDQTPQPPHLARRMVTPGLPRPHRLRHLRAQHTVRQHVLDKPTRPLTSRHCLGWGQTVQLRAVVRADQAVHPWRRPRAVPCRDADNARSFGRLPGVQHPARARHRDPSGRVAGVRDRRERGPHRHGGSQHRSGPGWVFHVCDAGNEETAGWSSSQSRMAWPSAVPC